MIPQYIVVVNSGYSNILLILRYKYKFIFVTSLFPGLNYGKRRIYAGFDIIFYICLPLEIRLKINKYKCVLLRAVIK